MQFVLIGGGVILLLAILLPRGGELFYISVRDGKALVVRGRVPLRLLQDFADAVAQARVHRARIRGFKGHSCPRLEVGGADGRLEQRLRNIFGTHPLHNLQAAPGSPARNFGQVLGIAWLAWLLAKPD